MDTEQTKAFWDSISVLDQQGLLPYVAISGSWAEYIYQDYFKTNFRASIRTYDLDIFYPNIKKPTHKVNLAAALKEKGFEFIADPITGVGRFRKGNELDVEILTRALGSAYKRTHNIDSIGIVAQGLKGMNMLEPYIIHVQSNGFRVPVPAPTAYVLHKLYINPHRLPANKRDKDIAAVRTLLEHIKSDSSERDSIKYIFNSLSTKQQGVISDVADKNGLVLFAGEVKPSLEERLARAKGIARDRNIKSLSPKNRPRGR